MYLSNTDLSSVIIFFQLPTSHNQPAEICSQFTYKYSCSLLLPTLPSTTHHPPAPPPSGCSNNNNSNAVQLSRLLVSEALNIYFTYLYLYSIFHTSLNFPSYPSRISLLTFASLASRTYFFHILYP